MIINFKLKLVILVIFTFFYSHNVLAANFDLNIDKNILKSGEVSTLTINLDTEGQSINTIEGDLKYNNNFLKAEIINMGGSFINFWVEKPELKNEGIIHFSGITPGGISTMKGELFKVIFRGENVGTTNLSLENINLFLNDGKGTIVSTKSNSVYLKITENAGGTSLPILVNDKVSPEDFSIIRTRDQNIYDNKWFTVFSTLDKNSGISHYEVCELFKCVTAESPFLLRNQTPFYYIKVNAYDNNNNLMSSTLISVWFKLVIVIILLFILYFTFLIYHRYL